MKVPLNWLKEFIRIDMEPQEIAKWLTMAGLEVDAIETFSLGFQGIVIAKVLKTQKHPNADKLTLADVTDGKEIYHIVCGAPNCLEGMLAAFAPLGSTLIDEEGKPFKIKKTKIRGVESSGMLLTAKELGIGDSHEALLEFPADSPIGSSLEEALKETVFEISLTPNLGHCSSIRGIARELHAKTGSELIKQENGLKEENTDKIEDKANVIVNDTIGCPRYACRVLQNVKVGPSPKWLQNRLEASGQRPINNIVDATNYILLELGHPLHAFDFDKISDRKLFVRKANDREKFISLDGKERVLHREDLMIADAEKSIAIAGVIGSENSEVSDQTKNILLECAYFDPVSVRKTSKRQGLVTEASRRFERGIDPNLIPYALDKCAALIKELSQGTICKGMIDIKTGDFLEKSFKVRLSRIIKILGKTLSISEVEAIFKRLEFACKWDGEDVFTVTVPTYRNDILGEIDLIEEVARIFGYDHFKTGSIRFHPSDSESNAVFTFEREIRCRMIAEGLQEFLTCDLIGPKLLEVIYGKDIPEDQFIKVINPTSIEQSILRTSLLPGMLQTAKFNADRQNVDCAGFEVGRIHFKEGDQYREEANLAILLTGLSRPWHFDRKPVAVDYFDLKGIVENLLTALGIEGVSFKNKGIRSFHDGRQASIIINGADIGIIGEIHPAILRRLDVSHRIFFAEIGMKALFGLKSKMTAMKPLNLYPASERDWTITISEVLENEVIKGLIEKVSTPLLEKVTLIDVWQSPKLGKGMRNMTYRFTYRNTEETISQEIVDQEHAKITDGVRNLITSHI